ncbi:hypothetical protein M0D21_21660 [Aquimarina sp. D1M17]|uniref:hypothetical protein n=1 Tax=Aquimarina acroporae TaxID=2937283 RepID=UPI0020BF5DE1|nr:hypothetical protein [Aquimarina acroporae]MCK8524200.1 hypothetical protein [Aquimarina acroporae]
MFRVLCIAAVFSLYTCSTTKNTASNTSAAKTETQEITAKEMIEKGFSKGTLTISKSKGCTHILTIEEYSDNLDPINLTDFFKEDIPSQVWVKFANLRMASRCGDARPVSIIEISKREE